MMRLFHLSPVGQLLAAMRGTGVAELVTEPEPKPVSASDADGERFVVIAFAVGRERIDHVAFGPFPTHDEAAHWARHNDENWGEGWDVAELREPGGAAP